MIEHLFIQHPNKKEEVCFFCGAEKQYHVTYAMVTPEKYEYTILEGKEKKDER